MRKHIIAAFLFGLVSIALEGCVIVPPLFGGGRGPVAKQEVVPADGYFTKDEILILDLAGVVSIEGSQGWFGVGEEGMLVELKDRLLAAEDDPRIKAVILRIDSPGGGVTASDLIHHEILKFKKKTKVPVVAMMQDVAASGGFYIAMAADEVYAMPTTITGSIGVITMLPDLQGLSEKVGFGMRVIKSGANKDLGSPWRALSDQERTIFQTMIDKYYAQFLGIIMASREGKGLTKERLAELADGRVFDGKTAAEAKLIDGVTYLDDVIEKTKKLAKIDDARVVSYEYPGSYRGNIYARSRTPKPTLSIGGGDMNMLKIDAGLKGVLPPDTRFMYMWLP